VNAHSIVTVDVSATKKVFKQKKARLKPTDVYQTGALHSLCACPIEDLVAMGFNIELVRADCLYGEYKRKLCKLALKSSQ